MQRKVIWSTHEDFIYVDILKKEYNIVDYLDDKEVEQLLAKNRKENIKFLEDYVMKKFNKPTSEEVIAFAHVYDSTGRRQIAVEIGKNYKNIFTMPFDKATWYVDGWNIKADITHNGVKYVYTFRTLKDNTKKREIVRKINSGRPMLTGTFLGNHTKTVLRK